MNKVVLMGRLTRDPDIRYTQGQQSMCVARYTLAIDRRKANQDGSRDADFISCVAFGRHGEFAQTYLHQGSKICLEGHIQTGSYTDRDGRKVYTTDVIVDSQEFAESRATAENRQNAQQGGYGYQQNNYQQNNAPLPYGQQTQPQQYQQQPQQYEQQSFQYTNEGFMSIPENVDDSGLPFN